MFWIGVAPLVLLLPLLYWLLPESLTYLAAAGRRAEAEELAARYGVPAPETFVGIVSRTHALPAKKGVSRSGLPSTPTDEQSFRIRGTRADARPDPTGN